MPIHRQKKLTTADTPDSRREQPAPGLPAQQQFRQYLRELARSGIRMVLERVMREELDALIGVGWGESSPQRKGYRNGYYQRDLVTTSGRIEELNVPRDREGQFHTQVFDRYRRYEPQVAEAAHGDVRGWNEHAQGRGSRPNLNGSDSQRQCHQPPQPRFGAAIHCLA